MTYSWLTYAQARTDILQRLNDPAGVYWLNNATAFNEVGQSIKEALRTWNSITGYWRNRALFNTTANTPFYDLTSVLNPAIRAYTVTDREIIASMQYRLSENLGQPATGDTWTGTSMFSLSDLVASLQEQRDAFLEETGIVLSVSTEVCAPPGARYGFSNDSVIDVRRMAWIDPLSKPNANFKSVLWRQDEFQMTAYNPNWSVSQGINPQSYSLAASPVLTFALSPVPVASGSVELITTNSGAALNPSTPRILGIPDDWTNVVKWGTLADLLSYDGPAPDPMRSAYCNDRWESGLRLARLAPCIIAAQINSIAVMPTTLWDFDMYNPGWENFTTGQPQIAAAGLNLVAVAPGNTTTTVALTLDVIQNATVPVADGDFIQVGREEWDAISGYVQHVLSFKLGGDDFMRTVPLYHDFLKQAALYLDRASAYAPMLRPMSLQMHTECEKVYRRLTDSVTEVTANASN